MKFPAVDAIAFFRPDKRDEELKREARRIFVPRRIRWRLNTTRSCSNNSFTKSTKRVCWTDFPTVASMKRFASILARRGSTRSDSSGSTVLTDGAERRRQFNGERTADQAAMDWEILIPPNGRLVMDESGGEYGAMPSAVFKGATGDTYGNSTSSAPYSNSSPTHDRADSTCSRSMRSAWSSRTPDAATPRLRAG